VIRWRRETILDAYNLGLGIILLAVPWLFAFAHTKASVVNVTIGLAIAFMSALELWLVHDDPAPGIGRGTAVS
jgi:hypothetical protein